MNDAPAISLEGLTKDYGAGARAVRALDRVDLTVERGQIFGFLVPNGAGKTTTIRILLDLIRPTAGRALVLGIDAQRDTVEARRRIGYLPDDPKMYPRLTALEYFALVDRVRGARSGAGVDRAFRDRLIERLELDPSRRIGELSRGNRQKVGIVQALMVRPPLLVLDEPTSGLDPLVQREVEALLREVAADGATVFFSSHALPEVEEICHRVAMLRAGRLIDVVDVAEQRRLAPQRFAVTFAVPPPGGAFDALDGVAVVSCEGVEVLFETHDGVDALVKRLAEFTIARLETQELSLEELFLSYYSESGRPPGAGTAAVQEVADAGVR